MTDTTQNNHNQDDQAQDDQVLAQLYKEGAKETAPAKLNHEIIKYAANAEKPVGASSYFSGDWKVPLSLAASVVVVFGLLVQLDQNPKQLELPPIPEISAPTSTQQDKSDKTEPNVLNEEIDSMVDGASLFSKEAKESDLDALGDEPIEESDMDEELTPKRQLETQPSTIQTKSSAKKDLEQKQEVSRDRLKIEPSLEKSKSSNTYRLEGKSNNGAAAAPASSLPKPTKPADSQPTQIYSKDIDNRSNEAATTEGLMKQRSMNNELLQSREDVDASSDIAADVTPDTETQSSSALAEQADQEFAPIPVEDWLLMIEKLIARKDYAEAARQLQKFKQAHPKVNVEDLDAKIP